MLRLVLFLDSLTSVPHMLFSARRRQVGVDSAIDLPVVSLDHSILLLSLLHLKVLLSLPPKAIAFRDEVNLLLCVLALLHLDSHRL